MAFTKQFEALPKIAKVLILFIFGVVVSGVYRIVRYLENRDTVTLVAGLLCFTGIGVVLGILDAVTEILYDEITFFAN